MNIYVANTDEHWYQFLLDQQNVDEVNFWKPMGNSNFAALKEGELFLFKLKKKFGGKVVGFGQFLMFQPMNVRDAWDFFGMENGVESILDMMQRINHYTRKNRGFTATRDHTIGAIVVTNPVFFPHEFWVDAPEDWKDQIVTGKTYGMESEVGRRLVRDCLRVAEMLQVPLFDDLAGVQESKGAIPTNRMSEQGDRYSDPVVRRIRLGQGGFRMKIRSIYGKCAVSEEHSMPVLEAAHIRSYADDGSHEITNGILFRSDIHKLYDRGYVTVDPDYRFRVSGRLNEEYNNGKTYYQLDQKKIWLPSEKEHWPDQENLEYHQQEVFLG